MYQNMSPYIYIYIYIYKLYTYTFILLYFFVCGGPIDSSMRTPVMLRTPVRTPVRIQTPFYEHLSEHLSVIALARGGALRRRRIFVKVFGEGFGNKCL